MESTGDSERVEGVSHLAGSLKQQRQNAVKIDVTADVLADRIKVRVNTACKTARMKLHKDL